MAGTGMWLVALPHLAPGKFEWNFRHIIFKKILVIDGWGISCEIALIWMSLDFTDDQSTLVQVMAWCRQTTNHYLSQCWPRSVSPYDVTRPQLVNHDPSLCTAFPHCLRKSISFPAKIQAVQLRDTYSQVGVMSRIKSTVYCSRVFYQLFTFYQCLIYVPVTFAKIAVQLWNFGEEHNALGAISYLNYVI